MSIPGTGIGSYPAPPGGTPKLSIPQAAPSAQLVDTNTGYGVLGFVKWLQLMQVAVNGAAPMPKFGTGAPISAATEGATYFDTSASPYQGYVWHGGGWNQFS
jgi:hypothetical protein